MENSPFVTKEGGEVIANFVYKELIPSVKNLSELAIKASRFQYKFFLTRRLFKLNKEYKNCSRIFFESYKKWHTPDILFEGVKASLGKDAALLMGDYFNTRAAIKEHLDEGFRLISYINEILSNQNAAFYNQIMVFLSLSAIVISIISVIKSSASNLSSGLFDKKSRQMELNYGIKNICPRYK